MDRRSFLAGSAFALSFLSTPVVIAGERNYNHYVGTQADLAGVKTRVVKSGETWGSVFGTQAKVAQYFNRQNLQLAGGQLVLVPPKGVSNLMSASISPFSQAVSGNKVFVLVSPTKYAWGLFRAKQLLKWGPAVCGGDWCADVRRACHSPTGTFTISEVAGPYRRSKSYPREQAAEGKGALMPYFMRITDYGVGLHARYMRGRHETHGCIGIFYDDAKWLNKEYASKGALKVKVASY